MASNSCPGRCSMVQLSLIGLRWCNDSIDPSDISDISSSGSWTCGSTNSRGTDCGVGVVGSCGCCGSGFCEISEGDGRRGRVEQPRGAAFVRPVLGLT